GVEGEVIMTERNFEQLDQLARDFWHWRAFYQPASSDDIPRIERPRDWEPDWSRAAIEKQREALSAFVERWKRMDVSAWPIPRQVDYQLIGSALARVRWELDVLRSWERNPRFYVYQTLGALFEELLKNRPFDHDRSAEIVKCLRRIPKMLTDGKANLARAAVKPFALVTLDLLRDLRPRLSQVARELKPRLAGQSAEQIEQATEEAIAALEDWRAWLEAQAPTMSEELGVG